ncbi:MAG: WXG100 family type VII secretion target [Clostridia bacterium]|nr:WXG100 family type VII secretion target [Clostridia bacterium]MBQ9719741.1 WXG100 family type VII secretion target [Oscillospiraceae bacterium]
MADKILVSTSEMNATITKYNDAQSTMQEAQKSMRAALDNLNGCWKGPAWAAMMYKWTQIEANILKSQAAVNRSIVALRNTISHYDEGEDTNKSTGSSLDVGSQTTVYVD